MCHQRGGFLPHRMGLCVFLSFLSPIRLFSSSKQQSLRRPPPRLPLRASSTMLDYAIDRPSGLDCARCRYVALGCLGVTTAFVLLVVFVCVFPDQRWSSAIAPYMRLRVLHPHCLCIYRCIILIGAVSKLGSDVFFSFSISAGLGLVSVLRGTSDLIATS